MRWPVYKHHTKCNFGRDGFRNGKGKRLTYVKAWFRRLCQILTLWKCVLYTEVVHLSPLVNPVTVIWVSFYNPEHTCHIQTGRQRDPWPAVSETFACLSLRGCDIFRVGVGKAQELILVQIHDKQLVGGSELHGHFSELPVKVAGISTVSLEKQKGNSVSGIIRQYSTSNERRLL